MASKLEEMRALRAEVNQILKDHTSTLSRRIDTLFEAAVQQKTPEPEDTPVLSSLQAAGVADSFQNPNDAKVADAKVDDAEVDDAKVDDPKDSEISALAGMVSNQTERPYGSVFITERQLEKFVNKSSQWTRFTRKFKSPVEPIRTGYLAHLVNSKRFDAITVLVIFAHIAFTIIETNWQMRHKTMATTTLMFNIELAFTCAYTVELAMRLAVHRCYFFCNNDMTWNLLDLSLVIAGIADAIAYFVKSIAIIGNPSFLRFFRVLRVAKKLLRVVRLLHFFSELRLMIGCVMGSVRALFWCFVMLFGFALVFSILIVQQFTIFLADSNATAPISFVSDVEAKFGSVWVALLSLFMAISGGEDWGIFYALTTKTGALNPAFFLVYIALVWLSITNIIISIFCDKALNLAQPDLDERLLEKQKRDLQKVREIKRFFGSLDLNKSGTLSIDELQACMHDVQSLAYFDLMGLDIKDAEFFFRMLTSHTEQTEVDVHGFVTGWLKMKGAATSLDVYTVQYQTQMWVETMLAEIAGFREDMVQLSREVTRFSTAHSQGQDDGHTMHSKEDSDEHRENFDPSTVLHF